MMAWLSQEHALNIRSMAASFRAGSYNPLKRFLKLLCLMAASSVILLGLLHMHPLQLWLKGLVPTRAWRTGRHILKVTHCCVRALVPWKAPCFYQNEVLLGSVARRKVIMIDAFKMGWGTLSDSRIAFGSWTTSMSD